MEVHIVLPAILALVRVGESWVVGSSLQDKIVRILRFQIFRGQHFSFRLFGLLGLLRLLGLLSPQGSPLSISEFMQITDKTAVLSI